jgi:hypothetical protein
MGTKRNPKENPSVVASGKLKKENMESSTY